MSVKSLLAIVARGAAWAAPYALPVFAASLAAQMAFTSVARGHMSDEDLARQVTVRTAAEWKTLWQGHAPTEKMPAVDFDTQMVVGLFLGSKPSDGYDVEIVGVRTEGTALVVEYAQKQPGRGTMAAQMLTAPYHFVAVAKHPGPVRFLHIPDTRR